MGRQVIAVGDALPASGVASAGAPGMDVSSATPAAAKRRRAEQRLECAFKLGSSWPRQSEKGPSWQLKQVWEARRLGATVPSGLRTAVWQASQDSPNTVAFRNPPMDCT